MYQLRPYIPPLGRWASHDPIAEAGGLNLYAFCGNGPISKWDYLGMNFIDDEMISLGVPVDALLSTHFRQLKEQLEHELKSMCPQETTKWEKGGESRYRKEACCTPENCKASAETLAGSYILALQDAYTKRIIPGGNWGNLLIIITGQSGFGHTYPDDITCLTCSGWQGMASASLPTAGDSCWVSEREQSVSLLSKIFGKLGHELGGEPDHTWMSLRVMNGPKKHLDPWPSGGRAYR